MTKMVTATCVMQVVESGLIGLDDDVRPLVPQLAEVKILRGFVGADVPYLEENTTPITLRYGIYLWLVPIRLCHSWCSIGYRC